MPLDNSCEKYLGKLVLVKPVYGWGWSRLDAPEISVPDQINGVPRPFHCRLSEFSFYRDEINGAVGRIEDSAHIYDGLWTFFYLRVRGRFNFTDAVGYYNLEIGPQPPESLDGKEWLEFTSGSPIVNGFAVIAENPQRIEKHEAMQIARWEIMRNATDGNF